MKTLVPIPSREDEEEVILRFLKNYSPHACTAGLNKTG
jgi:hypothetical protein